MSLDLALFRLINLSWGFDALAPVMKVLSNPFYWLPVIAGLVAWMIFREGGTAGSPSSFSCSWFRPPTRSRAIF